MRPKILIELMPIIVMKLIMEKGVPIHGYCLELTSVSSKALMDLSGNSGSPTPTDCT